MSVFKIIPGAIEIMEGELEASLILEMLRGSLEVESTNALENRLGASSVMGYTNNYVIKLWTSLDAQTTSFDYSYGVFPLMNTDVTPPVPREGDLGVLLCPRGRTTNGVGAPSEFLTKDAYIIDRYGNNKTTARKAIEKLDDYYRNEKKEHGLLDLLSESRMASFVQKSSLDLTDRNLTTGGFLHQLLGNRDDFNSIQTRQSMQMLVNKLVGDSFWLSEEELDIMFL